MIIPSFKDLSEVANSRYELAILVSKRARKLIDGNPKLIDTARKNRRIKLRGLRRGIKC